MLKTFPKQRGNSLVVSIFVIVIVSALAAAMSKVLIITQESLSVEVVGYRALQSANVGVESGLQLLFPLDANPALDCTAFPISQAGIGNVSGLLSCQVTVQCDLSQIGTQNVVFRLESQSSCNAGGLNTSRVVVVEARRDL